MPAFNRIGRSLSPLKRASRKKPSEGGPYVVAAAVTVGALAVTALITQHLAKKAETENPATGLFLEVNGVRLHYVERGSGDPLILLHGNGSMIEDFETSGLIDLAAKNHRVIVFDRPGFGHSARPRNVTWTPDAQANCSKARLSNSASPAQSFSVTHGAHPSPLRLLSGFRKL
jgi:hypothetical protein